MRNTELKEWIIRARSKHKNRNYHEFRWYGYTPAQAVYEFNQGMSRHWEFVKVSEAKEDEVLKFDE